MQYSVFAQRKNDSNTHASMVRFILTDGSIVVLLSQCARMIQPARLCRTKTPHRFGKDVRAASSDPRHRYQSMHTRRTSAEYTLVLVVGGARIRAALFGVSTRDTLSTLWGTGRSKKKKVSNSITAERCKTRERAIASGRQTPRPRETADLAQTSGGLERLITFPM